jgi:subtilisin family serine protease
MFTYTIDGKEHELDYSKRFVVVRTKENKSLKSALEKKSSKDLLPFLESYDEYPHKGVYVLKCKEENTKTLAVRNSTREQFSNEKKIRFAGRALEDPRTGKPVVYTENIVVKFKNGISPEQAEKILQGKNLQVSSQKGNENISKLLQNVYVAKIPEGAGAEVLFEKVNQLAKSPHIEYVYPELITKRKFKAINPHQWHLAETVIRGVRIKADISVQSAWKKTRGKGVTVAIIDDGVDISHPEFKDKVIYPYDATVRSANPMPKYKKENHGTSVAGVAVAAGIKASGVAPEAMLMPIRMSSNLGSIEEVEAFAWAITNGADVISCSWGPEDGAWDDQVNDGDAFELPPLTRDIIREAVTKGRKGKGIVVLFAAGNGNENVETDGYASNNDVIAVAACNDSNKRSVYSDYGSSVFCCFPSDDCGWAPFGHPEPNTPGIYTTDRLGSNGYSKRNYTNDFGGTSSATPGVAGVIALMLSANPSLTVADIKKIIKATCDKIDKVGGKYDKKGHSIYYGYGKVNAARAVAAARRKKKK